MYKCTYDRITGTIDLFSRRATPILQHISGMSVKMALILAFTSQSISSGDMIVAPVALCSNCSSRHGNDLPVILSRSSIDFKEL